MDASERITPAEIRDLSAAEHEAYEALELFNDDGTSVPPDGRYWRPLEAWLRGYDPHALPIASTAMRKLTQAYAEFNATGEAEPPVSFWHARDEARRQCLLDPPPAIQRKTPTEMHAEKVPLRIIANEWRWFLPGENNLPDIERVQREIDKPGSELTPEAIEARHRFDLEIMGYLSPELPAELDPEHDNQEPTEVPTRIDDLETLIRLRVPISQIAAIKSAQYAPDDDTQESRWLADNRWAELALALAELMGISDIAHNAQELLNEAGQDFAAKQYGQDVVDAPLPTRPSMPEMEVTIDSLAVEYEEPAEPLTPEQRVLELFQQGNDVVAIARDVRMKPARVKKIIAEASREHQAADAGN
jgi:hypothetical protein